MNDVKVYLEGIPSKYLILNLKIKEDIIIEHKIFMTVASQNIEPIFMHFHYKWKLLII